MVCEEAVTEDRDGRVRVRTVEGDGGQIRGFFIIELGPADRVVVPGRTVRPKVDRGGLGPHPGAPHRVW